MEGNYRKEHIRHVHQQQNPDWSILRHMLVELLNIKDKNSSGHPGEKQVIYKGKKHQI